MCCPGTTIVLLLLGAAAVAGCSDLRPAPELPPATVDTAFAVCAPPPDAGAEACACEDPNEKKARLPKAAAAPAPTQTPAAFDPELQRFLRALGGACAVNDFALLAKSVRFPLRWSAIVNENVDEGAPITKLRRIRRPQDLCAKNVFAGLQGVDPAFPGDPLSIAEKGPECRVTTLVGQFDASLVLEKVNGGWVLVAIEEGN